MHSLKFKIFLLTLCTQFFLAGCSSKKTTSNDSGPSEADFIVDDGSGSSEEVVSLDDDIYAEIDNDLSQESNLAADNIYDDVDQVEAFNSSMKKDVYKVLSDNSKVYKAKEGETLMWIAYKLYGDYRAWKKLKAWNEDALDYDNAVVAGTELKYEPLTTAFTWKSQGNPYIILKGDSLSKISKKVYDGEIKYWKSIWTNNQLQVRDPNLIFAGFTLFYLPYEEVKRELASDEKI